MECLVTVLMVGTIMGGFLIAQNRAHEDRERENERLRRELLSADDVSPTGSIDPTTTRGI